MNWADFLADCRGGGRERQTHTDRRPRGTCVMDAPHGRVSISPHHPQRNQTSLLSLDLALFVWDLLKPERSLGSTF